MTNTIGIIDVDCHYLQMIRLSTQRNQEMNIITTSNRSVSKVATYKVNPKTKNFPLYQQYPVRK